LGRAASRAAFYFYDKVSNLIYRHFFMELNMNIADLETLGYVKIKYPANLRECVKRAMASWQQFCNLPDSEKRRFSGGDRVMDFGYMRRQDKIGRADDKELFHAIRTQMPELVERAGMIDDARATAFIFAVNNLIRASIPAITSFARLVEERYGLAGFEEAVAKSAD
jgi:hypothetical protein